MRKLAVVLMAALMPLSLISVGANATPAAKKMSFKRLPALAPVKHDALSQALDQGRISEAKYALARAMSVSRLGAVRRAYGQVSRPDPHSATILLRDLALRARSLSGDDLTAAKGLLARPNQGGPDDGYLEYNTAEAAPVDSAHFRIHSVGSGTHASAPSYVAQISATMEEVYTKEITTFGWDAPPADTAASPNGGNNLFDVYLGNVGVDGLYGYCTTDFPQTTFSQYSYCVLDNDFSASEFGNVINGITAAQVTAAHEYHHAVQFGYDVSDDAWLMESVATWMEDEVYDSINDNYQYLGASSLARPQTPADTWNQDFGSPDGGFQYGQFIWMKYLSERFATRDVIRDVWDNIAGGTSQYSLTGMESMLATRGTDFASAFGDFAAKLAKPSAFFEEGAAYEQKVSPAVRSGSHNLATAAPSATGSFTNVDHLSSRLVSFKPATDVPDADPITLAVNLGDSNGTQRANVVTINGSSATVTPMVLDATGAGQLTVPNFGAATEVVLVMSNASNKMSGCSQWQPGRFSCGGTPVNDNKSWAYGGAIGTTAPDIEDPGQGGDTQPPLVSNVFADPATFTANGRKSTLIFFTVDEASTVQLTIVNSSGTKVFGFKGPVPAAGDYQFQWFGQNTKGTKLVPAGRYTVKVKATDVAGNVSTVKKTKVQVKR